METLGQIEGLRGDPEASLQYFEKEYSQFSRPLLLPKMANIYIQQKKWDEAQQKYEEFFRIKPKFLKYRHPYAQVLFNQKDYIKAEQVLAPLLQVKRPMAKVLLLQANILAKTDRMKEGKKLFQQAKEEKKRELFGRKSKKM